VTESFDIIKLDLDSVTMNQHAKYPA